MIYLIGAVFIILVVVLIFVVQNIVKQGTAKKTVAKKKSNNTKPNQTKSKPNNNYQLSAEHQRKNDRKGELGEYKIDLQLEQLSSEFKSLSDVLIRTKNGLTQIDHVLITPVGLFVIETKNYQGKIYGNKRSKQWKQYCNGGTYTVFNPLRQNYGHIQGLKGMLTKYNKLECYSIISFTKRCEELRVDDELKSVESNEMVVMDIRLSELIMRKYRKVLSEKTTNQLSDIQIEEIYQTIKNANITDPAIREEHIREVKKKQA